MTDLTPTRLAGGFWHGFLRTDRPRPALRATHQGRELPGLTWEAGDGGWHVRLPIPPDVLADGVQTIVIADAATGEALASLALIAGEPLADDLRAEIDLLRAELDMLKRAFRRHCVETGG